MLIICHYDEIALKGKNRDYFEKKLVENIKNKLNKEIGKEKFERISRVAGRVLIKGVNNKEVKRFLILKEVFGIANFVFAKESSQDIKSIKDECWNLLKNKKFDNFRITASRSDKNFPLTSAEINMEVGTFIVEKTNKKVKLKDAQVECYVELANKKAFIYVEKYSGSGGLPVGTSGKVLALLSGGIDSPVAAYYLLKRGAKVDFIHFHSLPYTSPASNEKVVELVKRLSKYQRKASVYMIPFAKIQQQIIISCPEKLRVIFYRRLMMKIAQKLAQEKKYLALCTGEVLSQVASQTLENIVVTDESVDIPVLRPIIGLDKIDVIKKAQEIGTYETSILPHEDCCTRFVPKHPETKARLEDVLRIESELDFKGLINHSIKEMEVRAI